jgi:hypothetical protein
MKVTVKELNDFFDARWSDFLGGSSWDPHGATGDIALLLGERNTGWICEECAWFEDEVLSQAADTLVTLDRSGVVSWEGQDGDATTKKLYSPFVVFKKWKTHQTTSVLVCSVPKEKEAELREFVVRLGGSC